MFVRKTKGKENFFGELGNLFRAKSDQENSKFCICLFFYLVVVKSWAINIDNVFLIV